MHIRMHALHEVVEMDALLFLHRRMGKEQIHQHGLAPPHPAEEIEPARRRHGAAKPEQPALAPWLIALQRVVQHLKLIRRRLLRRIMLDGAGVNEIAIGGNGVGRFAHASRLAALRAGGKSRPPGSSRDATGPWSTSPASASRPCACRARRGRIPCSRVRPPFRSAVCRLRRPMIPRRDAGPHRSAAW